MGIQRNFIAAISTLLRPSTRRAGSGTERLFDGDDLLFRSLIADSDIYGEYGVGLSTLTAFEDSKCRIVAVDSSQEWIKQVTMQGVDPSEPRVSLHWVDLGPLLAWG